MSTPQTPSLTGRTVAFLAADGVERVELVDPWHAVEQAGGTPVLVSLSDGEITSMDGDIDPSERFTVDRTVADAQATDFDALVLPGGVANPDSLRADQDAVAFVRAFFDDGRPVAAICHAPWTLIDAGVVAGRTLTSFPSVATDLRNAGGTWVDEEVHVSDGLVTSRNPDDLPAFCATLVREFADGGAAR
ncbi:DJ-1/PfpI/YhbO family deglycase/protease [Conexibacter sp. W3-3-2]|uniref:Peptidase C56 n=1 Tax=Paraconexibacter algicola TaxID=2133960 RepID=A0A2T4UK70_9ACTN|nr:MULTISPECIES: type 1 glutamine amidotransferase domain-containing protein [Solirubrobacterales]MTD45986.1 DJ-1/PfpI/YhbO family deglycase/protease [Conexibacter sp. W3-3-2]PTL59646.1 peptidase C56 [Paraconexibacter algicola]